jgi:hypothetical protein
MKKILIAAAVTLMCGAAFAQTGTGPAAQSDDTGKPGVTNGTMDHGSKGKSSMNKGSGTTTGMGQTGKSSKHAKKDMSKDGSPPTEKDGMSKE